MIDWTSRPVKEVSRVVVAKHSSLGKKHLLAMPSDSGRDIQLLLEHQVATSESLWTLVDRDAEKIKAFKKLNILDSKQTTFIASPLSSAKLNKPVDFAWFDLCGNLTKLDMFWLRKFSFDMDADIWFTFSLKGGRGNFFFNNMTKLIPDKFPKIIDQISNQHQDDFSNADIKDFYRTPMIIQWLLLRNIFPSAASTHCYFYQDASPMALFHLSNFGEKKPASEVDVFINAFLSEDCLVQQILEAKSDKAANALREQITLFANQSSNPGRYKEKIKRLVAKGQQRLLQAVFD